MATVEVRKDSNDIGGILANGFSLIELLIALAIISVLALILYPNYTSSTRKAKRSDAIKSIQLVSNRLEKYMTYCNSYTTEFGGSMSQTDSESRCTGLGINGVNANAINSENDYYSLSIACAENCMTYEVKATARGGQLKDTSCQTFTYSSRGKKTANDSSKQESTDICWK